MIRIETLEGEIKEIEILPGDAFAVCSEGLVARGIRFFSKIWSSDNEATYTHCGLMLSEHKVFEAGLFGISTHDLDKYWGKQLIIVRFDSVSEVKREEVLKQLVAKFAGKKYPVWRLFMHIFGPLSKVNLVQMPVCSELDAYYEQMLGIRHDQWAGTSPDTLVDEWRKWRDVTVLGEGKLL